MRTISGLIHSSGFQAVLNIFVGFLLAQLGGYFVGRRERKKAISSALAELLEVKSRLFGLEGMIDRITDSLGNVPEHEKSQIRVFINSLLPKWDDLHLRYEPAVTTLAGLDPLLAFHLRSKDTIMPILNWLHSLMGQDPKAAAQVGPILKKLMNSSEPVLNKSILLLASKKSWVCWYRTKRLLKKTGSAGEEAMEFLRPMMDAIKAGIPQAPPHPQNPPDPVT